MTDDVVDRDPAGVLLGALTELRSLSPDAWLDGDITDRAIRLDRVVALVALLKVAQADLELDLADSMVDNEMPTPVGVLRRLEIRRSTWATAHAGDRMRDDLARAVAAEVAMDNATGEIDPLKRNVAMAALRAIYEAIPSFTEVKVAGRKRFGIDMGLYRTYHSHYTVQIGEPDDR
jgi:hypothetical protein